jgi:hypothetical protein
LPAATNPFSGGTTPFGNSALRETRRQEHAADARPEETGVLRRTIEAGPTWLSLEPGVLREATAGWIASAPVGRLFDVVDEHLREDRPR